MAKPIFVASVPRACSTAFERVFMTRDDILECVHEPFGDAYYFGPERLGLRYDGESAEAVKARKESGFAGTTYGDVLERLLAKAIGKRRLFIKDITYYLVAPAGKPVEIAPSLRGLYKAASAHTNGVVTNVVNGTTNGVNGTTDATDSAEKTEHKEDAGNPTVLPLSVLRKFQFTFLIRNPANAILSYYRCTVPPLSEVTGFHYFDPSEAGFRETRILLEYLLETGLLRREDVVLIDADDLLDNPEGIVRKYCERVGIDFQESMLSWEAQDCVEFEKWKGFHEDAMKSGGLKARTTRKPVKTEEQHVREWTEKYGEPGAKLIQKTVAENMDDYEWMKQFRLIV